MTKPRGSKPSKTDWENMRPDGTPYRNKVPKLVNGTVVTPKEIEEKMQAARPVDARQHFFKRFDFWRTSLAYKAPEQFPLTVNEMCLDLQEAANAVALESQ